MKKEKFIPLEKQSKRAQRTYYAEKRVGWGEVAPVTRVIPNKKRQVKRGMIDAFGMD